MRDEELSKVSALWESGRADFSVGSTRVGIDYRLVNRGGIYHHTSPAGYATMLRQGMDYPAKLGRNALSRQGL